MCAGTMEPRHLYRDLVLDHGRRPRNLGRPQRPSHRAEGDNPVCGDRLTLFLRLEDEVIREIGLEVRACAICTASASMMSELVKGGAKTEALECASAFKALMAGREPATHLGDLLSLSAVRQFPSRIKCAELAWHALEAALAGSKSMVTTEEVGS